MSVQEKVKAVKVLTPKGESVWSKLTTPDTKFKEEGEYTAQVKLSGEEASTLKNSIDEFLGDVEQATQEVLDEEIEAATGQKKAKLKKVKEELTINAPYEEVVDDDGMETGEYIFKFKMLASGTNKKTKKPWSRKPALFDAKGKPIQTDDLEVWNGSVIRISGLMTPYFIQGIKTAGAKLNLNAVQIIELVSGGMPSSASGFGFDAEDGGFDADEVASQEHDNNNDNEVPWDDGDGEAEEENDDF